jgi:hypothetical protein
MIISETTKKELTTETGISMNLEYSVVESFDLDTTQYGILVRIAETGEEETIECISKSKETVLELMETLAKDGVTPCTLKDIVYDFVSV